MATRKNRKLRTRRRNQRGGDGNSGNPVDNRGIFKKITNAIAGFFSKPTAPSPNAKSSTPVGPLLEKSKPKSPTPSNPGTSLPSNAVVINMPPKTPPPQPSVKVNKPLTPSVPLTVTTPQSTPDGLSSSFQGVTVAQQSLTPSGVQVMTPEKAMQPPQLSQVTGGKRKKNKRSKTQRKRK